MDNISKIRDKIIKLISQNPPDFDRILVLSNDLARLDPNYQRFFVDARTLIHLGRDSIKDHSTALWTCNKKVDN